LQQVGASAFAHARPIDPRRLPVPTRPRRRSLSRRIAVGLSHAWVLHRPIAVRGLVALLVLVTVVGLYQARDGLVAVGASVVRMVQGEFAAAGFAVTEIEVSGQKLTRDEDIATMLAFASSSSTITFDPALAMARLRWLQAVDEVTVRKIYPNKIVVEIIEKEPLLRWKMGNTTWLVDGEGRPIARDPGGYTELPLVVGAGANDDALTMVNSLNRHELLTKDLAALSRIGDRRWDLIYYTGLRVQLPELGVAQALDRLESYHRDYALLDRDVTLVDMRVEGMLALKPAVRDDDQDKDRSR
jgi:cell division protein FtsQ